MDEDVEATESNIVDNELKAVLGCFLTENLVSELNREKI